MNALLHGLFAAGSEEPVAAQRRAEMREQLMAEWRPGSMMEGVLVDQMVDATLQLERMPEVRAAALAMIRRRKQVPDHVTDAQLLAADLISDRPRMAPIDQCQQRLSRQLGRLTRDLRQLQQDRAQCDAQPDCHVDTEAGQAEEAAEDVKTEGEKTNPIPSEVMESSDVMPALTRACEQSESSGRPVLAAGGRSSSSWLPTQSHLPAAVRERRSA